MLARVIGGGLAGAEAAYQLAIRGAEVELYEMRPVKQTPVHKGAGIAELVCSNSLKSADVNTAQGTLKEEMRLLGSVVLRAAYESRVPAGGALAVDRELFSAKIEKALSDTGRVTVIRREVTRIDENTIVATGPLTSDKMASEIEKKAGAERLYFFDAAAPIITGDSVNREKAFFAARYGKGDSDYLNCPMNKEEYLRFYDELVNARKVILKDFEKGELFEGCMPIEEMARRGADAIRFGPLRPVGIKGKDGEKYYAVDQSGFSRAGARFQTDTRTRKRRIRKVRRYAQKHLPPFAGVPFTRLFRKKRSGRVFRGSDNGGGRVHGERGFRIDGGYQPVQADERRRNARSARNDDYRLAAKIRCGICG